jgi:hypothetical protein
MTFQAILREFWRQSNDESEFDDILRWLTEFFALTRETALPLAMLSKKADRLWHYFICCTEAYYEYCYKHFGYFIHHRPRTSASPVPPESMRHFISTYERCCGKLPPFWLSEVPTEVAAYATGRSEVIPMSFQWSGWPGRDPTPMQSQ